MTRTLDRPTTDTETHHHFLHGIDLNRLHIHKPASRKDWGDIVAIIVMAIAVITVLLLATPVPEPGPPSGHDSGIELALRNHQSSPLSAND